MLEGHDVDFEPVFDFLLIYKLPKNKTAGGLALPDGVDTSPPKGLVIKAGPGRVTELGQTVEMPVKEGDIVYCCFSMHGPPPEIEFKGKNYLVIRARDLIGKASS